MNRKTISPDGLFRVSTYCHWCGVDQTSPTVFASLVKCAALEEDEYLGSDMIEIVICQDCFREMFGGDYNKLISECLAAWDEDDHDHT